MLVGMSKDTIVEMMEVICSSFLLIAIRIITLQAATQSHAFLAVKRVTSHYD